MLDELTKKELRQQLKLNGIGFTTKATEDELRELLKAAIDAGKAELKTPEGEHDEDEKDDESASDSDGEKDSSSSTDDVVPDSPAVQEEKQADLMACMRQNMGLPPFADKWEK